MQIYSDFNVNFQSHLYTSCNSKTFEIFLCVLIKYFFVTHV